MSRRVNSTGDGASFGPASSRALDRVRDLGLDLPAKPTHRIPEIPEDITALDDSALMKLWQRLLAWEEYMPMIYATAVEDARYAEERLKAERAAGAVRHSGRKTVAETKALAEEDPAVVKAVQTHSDAIAYLTVLKPVADRPTGRLNLCSRELSRRQARSNTDGRAATWRP